MFLFCSKLNDVINILKSTNNNVFLYGAGAFGKLLGKYLNEHNLNWNGYIETHLDEPQIINQKKVYSLNSVPNNNAIVIISVANSIDSIEIYSSLIETGFNRNNIVAFNGSSVFNELGEVYYSYSNYTHKIASYKNKHVGERCFVIGNGPSLTLSDLNMLKEEYSFACNDIFLCYDKTEWSPTYYMVSDSIAIKQRFNNADAINRVAEKSQAFFTTIKNHNIFKFKDNDDIKNLVFFNTGFKIECEEGLQFLYDHHNDYILRTSLFSAFSDNCEKLIYGCGTVTYRMLQLAIYMGFKEIYLLGVDNSYASSGDRSNTKDHSTILSDGYTVIDGKVTNLAGFYVRTDIMEIAYKSAKKYAEEHNIKIYNATRGGKLEVFPRVDFDLLF